MKERTKLCFIGHIKIPEAAYELRGKEIFIIENYNAIKQSPQNIRSKKILQGLSKENTVPEFEANKYLLHKNCMLSDVLNQVTISDTNDTLQKIFTLLTIQPEFIEKEQRNFFISKNGEKLLLFRIELRKENNIVRQQTYQWDSSYIGPTSKLYEGANLFCFSTPKPAL